MTSHRPYRRQRSAEEAFAELRRCAEKQFDPELVEHFIKAIRHTQRDPIQSADEDFMQELDEALQSDEVVEQIDNAAALAKSLSSGGRRIVSPTLEDETELDLGEAPAPVAPGPRLEQQLSQQKYLRLRLEIERLACTFETGNVAALSAMADHLHELAAAEGIKDIADRARFLERSARVADAHTVIQTVNELLRLCDSAQRLDEGMSQAIRRAFAWQMRSSEERSASAAAPAAAKMDMRLPSNPTERARRWGLMTPPAPTPAPAPASDPAPAAAPPPQPQRKVVHSPFAVQPITVFADAPAAEADPSRPLHAVRVSGIAA